MPDSNQDADGGCQPHATLSGGAQVFTSHDIDGEVQHHLTLPGRAHPLTFTIEQEPGVQMPAGWDPLPRGWARHGWLLWAAGVWVATVIVSVMLVGWPWAPSSGPQRLLGQLLPVMFAVLATVAVRAMWSKRQTDRLFAEINARDRA